MGSFVDWQFVGMDYFMGFEGVGHFVGAEGDGKFMPVDYYMG